MYNIGVKSDFRGVRKGSWTDEEDNLLRKCIEKYGEGNWHRVPQRAALNRCRKSCRLRWMNYLKPNIKRGQFSEDEVDLIIRLHKLLGNRWSLIAGRIPGRTANDVKNYWNTHLHKKFSPSSRPPRHPNTSSYNNNTIISRKNNSSQQSQKKRATFTTTTSTISTTTSSTSSKNITMQPQIIRPQPWTFPKTSSSSVIKKPGPVTTLGPDGPTIISRKESHLVCDSDEDEDEDEEDDNVSAQWWENLMHGKEEENEACNIRPYNGPDFGLGFQEPGCQVGLQVWPTAAFSEVPRSPVEEHNNVWEDDDLWNFDVNVWGNGA